MSIRKEIARKKDCLQSKLCSRNKLCTNLVFKILIDANDQSDNKLEMIFLEDMIKNISDSTWFLANGRIIHTKNYHHVDSDYKESKNIPYSFVVLGINSKTMSLKNLYEITFPNKDGKIFRDSFIITNSKTGELILSIKDIK